MTINLMSIEITGTDIDKAFEACKNHEGYPFQCPIGQALLRMFVGYDVEVSLSMFALTDKETGKTSCGEFQRSAKNLAEMWDVYETRNGVKPGFVGLRCEFNPVPIL